MSAPVKEPDRCDIDFGSEAFQTDPWPNYTALRQHDPVHWSERNRAFFVLKYEHVQRGLTNGDFTVDYLLRASREVFGRSMLDTDGQAHRTVRKLIAGMFSLRSVTDRAPGVIAPVLTEVLGTVAGRDQVDFVSEIAVQVPYRVMCRLIGVPVEDVELIYDLTRPIISTLDYPRGSVAEALSARDQLGEYFRGLVKRADLPRDSLAAVLAGDEAGLSESEIVGNLLLLLVAGTETSVSAIAIIMTCLLLHPGALRQAWTDPAMLGPIIRESLRWEPPLHSVLRFAGSDVELGQVAIPRWTPVLFSLASANRDEGIFDQPDRWNPARLERGALTFGLGTHSCMGMHFAERELQMLFEVLAKRFAPIEPAGRDIPPIKGHVFRRPAELWLRLQPRQRTHL